MSQIKIKIKAIFFIILGFISIILVIPWFNIALFSYGLRWIGIQFLFIDFILLGAIFIMYGKILIRPIKKTISIAQLSMILGLSIILLNVIGIINTWYAEVGLGKIFMVPLGFFIIVGVILVIHGIFYRKTIEIENKLALEIIKNPQSDED